jgi:serine/threonine-protein kinase
MREDLLVAGKYRMIRKLGEGGMGAVWLARNELTDREFAIKFLRAEGARDPLLLARFFQEARVSGKLRHPSILEIFDVGSAPELDGAPFLVMELLDGASLEALLHALGPLDRRLAIEIVSAVSRALALAHERGIVHRDLKPANIFLHRPGTGALVPKVLDFGISKISTPNTPDASPGLTQTGAVLGSPLYMSPEQASSDKKIDGRSDVHALGVVLWECLVGRPPFPADTYNNLVVAIVTGDRPRLGVSLPGTPPSLEKLVSRAFARNRDDRFAGAAELAEALEAELAKLGGPTLDSRTAAAELFEKVRAARQRSTLESTHGRGTTTGGMSVPAPSPATPPSPAAYTLGETPDHTARDVVAKPLPAVNPRRPGAVDTLQSAPAASARSAASQHASRSRPVGRRTLLAVGMLVPLAIAVVVGMRLHRSESASPSQSAAQPEAILPVGGEPSNVLPSVATVAPPPSASGAPSAAALVMSAHAKPPARPSVPSALPARPAARPPSGKTVQDDPNRLF